MTTKQTVKSLIDSDYMSYAMYVLENRAIPSCIDGFKPVSRKVLFSMLEDHKGKKTKVSDLGGISKHNYHHGEGSAMGAAITLGAEWQNNVPVFTQYGNFGTRLVPEAAAPRYIFAGLNPEFKKYFMDFGVCDAHSDKDNPEPQTYLPIIPWVLVNGIEGIAVGFACKYAPHNPKNLAKACIAYLSNKKIDNNLLVPSWPGFKGQVVPDESGDTSKTKLIGTVERVKRNTWVISEVPFGVDRETYYNHLAKMEEDSKIEDFEDACDDSGFNFKVNLNGQQDATCQKDPVSYFKLSKIYSENYTALDEKGKLKLFTDKSEIVSYFCDYRLKKTEDKLARDIVVEQTKNEWLRAKKDFISVFMKKNLTSVSKVDMESIALKITPKEDWVSKLIRIPAFEFTTNSVNELDAEITTSDDELVRLKSLDARTVFIERLKVIAK